MSAQRLGFIGLGVMGQPMVRNLACSGYRLSVHDRNESRALALECNGCAAALSPREVAQVADTVILMLPDSPNVEQVVHGDFGILEAITPRTLVIDMSTISPVATRRLAAAVEAKGAAWLDAPVSGGDKGAAGGTLSIMVGGNESDFMRAKPIFDVLGSTTVHVGAVGAGQTVKAANQIVVAAVFGALAEALNLIRRSGLDMEPAIAVLQGGLAHTRCLEHRRENLLTRSYEPGFRIQLHHKDLGIALDAARAAGVPLPITGLIREFMGSMIARGDGGLDHSGLFEFIAGIAADRSDTPV